MKQVKLRLNNDQPYVTKQNFELLIKLHFRYPLILEFFKENLKEIEIFKKN